MKMSVIVMGLGYIGLPTSALIASKEINVYGVDINEEIVNAVNQGKVLIVEPDLEGLVKYVVERGYLKAGTKPEEGDVFIIAVPTPFKDNHEPDISYVESAIKMIIPYLKENNLVIIESTSPIGTTEKMYNLILEKRPDLRDKIYIAYCPERVLPGKILYELEHNDRIVGGINEESSIKASDFYSLFVKGNIYKTNAKTAEMCKLVENAYRDVNIAFANELSIICDKIGIDVWELIELANKHPRVNILKPGPGVGGHCIAVDPWFIVYQFPQEAKLIRTAREVNDYKPYWVINKIEEIARDFRDKYNKKPVLGCLGLAYKPDIDDLRESPSLKIVKLLEEKGYKVMANEPNIKREEIDSVRNYKLEDIITSADLVFVLVPHKLYKSIYSDPRLKNKLYYFSFFKEDL